MKDYYYILGISNNASLEEVKKAYRKLSLKFHPDQNNGDKFFEERFRDINEAYETLNNEQRRKEYDTLLKARTGAGNSQSSNQQKQQYDAKAKAPGGAVHGKAKNFSFLKMLIAAFVIGVIIFLIKRPVEKTSPEKQLTEAYEVLMEEKKRRDSAFKLSYQKVQPALTDSPLITDAPQNTASFTRQLKTTMVRFCSFDTIANNWGKWTTEWSPTEIIHKLQQYDSSGLVFDVNFSFDNPPVYSRYSFAGYEASNDWFKYVANNGDMICVKGIQLSYLVSNGWPNFPIEIYYWSQRQRVALLFG